MVCASEAIKSSVLHTSNFKTMTNLINDYSNELLDQELSGQELECVTGANPLPGVAVKLVITMINKTIALKDHWSNLEKPNHPANWNDDDRKQYIEDVKKRFTS